jgi:hypothetical protein
MGAQAEIDSLCRTCCPFSARFCSFGVAHGSTVGPSVALAILRHFAKTEMTDLLY